MLLRLSVPSLRACVHALSASSARPHDRWRVEVDYFSAALPPAMFFSWTFQMPRMNSDAWRELVGTTAEWLFLAQVGEGRRHSQPIRESARGLSLEHSAPRTGAGAAETACLPAPRLALRFPFPSQVFSTARRWLSVEPVGCLWALHRVLYQVRGGRGYLRATLRSYAHTHSKMKPPTSLFALPPPHHRARRCSR